MPRILIAATLWLLFAALAAGQEAPTRKLRLVAPETMVYSSNGTGSLPTGALKRDALVDVYRELPDGWLEIAPPDGSFCWINNLVVNPVRNGVYVMGRVPVRMRVGSVVSPEKPTNVESIPVDAGVTLPLLRDKPVVVDGSTWWQVAPAPKERRYIQVAPGGATVVDTKPGVKTPATPPDSPFQPVTRQHDSDALWRQAQEADRAGNLAEAERLYAELGRVSTDETMRLLALNRAQFLRDAQRNAARTPQPRPEPVRPAPPPTPTVQPRPSPGKPALPSYPIGTAPAAGTANANNRSGPGRLERAPFQIDNRPGYVLMDSRGLPQMYVTAQDGLSLEEYVNRNVDLVGPIVYHGLLRKNYIRVTQVIPMQ